MSVVETSWLGDVLPTEPVTLTKHRKAEVVVHEHQEGWLITGRRLSDDRPTFTAAVKRCIAPHGPNGHAPVNFRDCLGHQEHVNKLAEKIKATYR